MSFDDVTCGTSDYPKVVDYRESLLGHHVEQIANLKKKLKASQGLPLWRLRTYEVGRMFHIGAPQMQHNQTFL